MRNPGQDKKSDDNWRDIVMHNIGRHAEQIGMYTVPAQLAL